MVSGREAEYPDGSLAAGGRHLTIGLANQPVNQLTNQTRGGGGRLLAGEELFDGVEGALAADVGDGFG